MLQKVKKILGNTIRENGNLSNLSEYVSWTKGDNEITLDGDFTIDELEAIVWWMKNTK